MKKGTIIQFLLLICVSFCLVQCQSTPAAAEEPTPAQQPAASTGSASGTQPASNSQQVSNPEPAPTHVVVHLDSPSIDSSSSENRQYGQARNTDTEPGIYVGIITFGPNAEDITDGSPILLDRGGRGLLRLSGLLDDKYQRDDSGGTALFYAAHMGLANMTKAQNSLPNLDHVVLVTFTDGLDVSSTGLTLTPIDDPENFDNLKFAGEKIDLYQEFVKSEIDNRQIGGSGINAYITAFRGDDITNISAFEDALLSLASSGSDLRGVPFVLPPAEDISELIVMFEKIATSLSIISALTEQNFTMITPQYPKETKVRMTFAGEKNAQEAQNAQSFVEGEVAIQNNEYYLTNIKYGGNIKANAVDQIKGTIEGNMVKYEFFDFMGYDLGKNYVNMVMDLKQWISLAGNNEWQINSEYELRPDSVTRGVRKNALVYLVLDKSSSIIPYDFPRVREAAKLFINMLHYSYYSQY